MINKIKYIINAAREYENLLNESLIKENEIINLGKENDKMKQENEILSKEKEKNTKYINYLLDKIDLIEAKRRANAGRVGGFKAHNNKLSNDLDKAKEIINKLNEENKKLKNRPTMQELIEYERTRKSPRKRGLKDGNNNTMH